MGEHLVLFVDRLLRPPNSQAVQEAEEPLPTSGRGVASCPAESPVASSSSLFSTSSSAMEIKRGEKDKVDSEGSGEDEPLLTQVAECRICQEDDGIHNLEVPCGCSGSLKYAHRKCVQRWCNEKGNTICEICHQPYQPGYTAPPPPYPEDATIDIGGVWTISGTPLDLHDPRLLAIADAERQFLEAEYGDFAASSASGAAFCRLAALVLMALLLMRHALTVSNADGDNDTSAFFSLFLLRAAGFLLPCYIMAWAISILQRRRQREDAAALAAAQVAFVLQSGQHRGVQFTIASRPPALPHEIA